MNSVLIASWKRVLGLLEKLVKGASGVSIGFDDASGTDA